MTQAKITRVESWVNLGIPDCIMALYGKFHLVELKVASERGKVKISPHQIAFHTAHKECPTWIFVQYDKGRKARLLVYEGWHAYALASEGITLKPSFECGWPWDWIAVEDHLTLFKK